MENLKIVGTENKIEFIWDLLTGGDTETLWFMEGNIIIDFKKTNSLKVQKEILERLKKREKMGLY